VSHNLWFLWLFIGLKVPLIGLFYFIFRVMRNQDRAWERGEYDGGWDDHDDDGGGGEPRVKPPAPPGGPSIRRRHPKPRAPRPALRGLPLRRPPRRRAEPLRTHDPRRIPHRTGV
jgi:hypothetical protein